jgi:acetyl esterase/lipase
VLDAVRAARRIPGAASGPKFAVWGESQGGHAALWTGMLARSYAPDLSLVGTAAAAPPTDLPANFRQASDPNVRALLTAFTAYSWSQRFSAPMATLFNRRDAGIATRLAQNNCIELGKKPKLGTILGVSALKGALRKKDITAIAPWAGLMRDNSVNSTLIFGPMLIAQSAKDPLVAADVTRAFAQRACRDRRPVRYIEMAGGDHGNSARDSAAQTLAWIDGRFAGNAAASDCGAIGS